MPSENNKFKRSRSISKSSKSNLHDKENNHENNKDNYNYVKEVREPSRDLPPIKKKSSKINEIKDIDIN